MGPADAYQGIGESLQADVMRFMAIIAFCLIAILALVRSVEPATPPAEAATAPPAVPQPQPAVNVAPPPEPATPPASRVPTPPEPTPPMPAEPVRPGMPAQQPAAAQPPSRPDPAAETPASHEPAAPDASRGLNLRFASQQDFLRLVNQGEVRLFAFRDGEVLSVSADFRFEPAAAPGRLHELLPETIPHLMIEALRRRSGAPANVEAPDRYRWGIVMPERMVGRIRDFVDRGVTGELIIDRFGEVRHHAA